jgi:hypothetical protein
MTPSISVLLIAASVAAPGVAATPAPTPAFKEADRVGLLAALDARAAHHGDLPRKIWGYSEVGSKETKSASAHVAELKAAGHEYKSRVPADQKPPLNYRDK